MSQSRFFQTRCEVSPTSCLKPSRELRRCLLCGRLAGAARTSASSSYAAAHRLLSLARRSGGFRLCRGGRGIGCYPCDGFLSLFHGPGYIGHQLFQIVLSGLNLRRLCIHFHVPIRHPSPWRKRARHAIFRAKSEQSLKDLASPKVIRVTWRRDRYPLSSSDTTLRAAPLTAEIPPLGPSTSRNPRCLYRRYNNRPRIRA